MQNTRLTSLFNNFSNQIRQFLLNPWRKISLLIISLLFGIFIGLTISTIAGQKGNLDVIVSALFLGFTEFTSWLTYRQNNRNSNSGLLENLNTFKVGITYSLYLQAFILGS